MSQVHNDSAPDTAQPRPPVEVFYSYSHKDEEFLEKLIIHLSLMRRNGLITSWYDRQISAGTEWKNQIDEREEAEPLYRRALAIYEKALGAEHPGVATVLGNYSSLLRVMDKESEAEKLENRASIIKDKHSHQDSEGRNSE